LGEIDYYEGDVRNGGFSGEGIAKTYDDSSKTFKVQDGIWDKNCY
jgi:hypothetical protein